MDVNKTVMKENKINIKIIFPVLIFGMLLSGCIDDTPEIGTPFDRVSNLSGSWQLTSVIQNDEVAISKGFPEFVRSVDLTERGGFVDYQLVLELDADGNPSSFSELNNNSPSILGVSSGTWTVDDPDAPATIDFNTGEQSRVLEIGTYLGLREGSLTLKLTKKQDGKPALSYEYKFQQATN